MKRIYFMQLFIAYGILTGIGAQPVNIPLYKNLSLRECKVSEYASSIRYVPLETKEACMLNEELQVIVSSQYIFIHDFPADKVYRFDANNGKFLNTIGKKGQGPGEYQRLFGIYVDEVSKKCFLMDSYSNKIYVHDFDGKYDSVIAGSYAPNRMVKIDNNYLLNNLLYTQTKNEIFLVDQKGKVLKKKTVPDKKYGMLLWPPYFFNHNGRIYYKNYISDDIYSISKSLDKTPAYFIDLGKRAVNPNEDQYRPDKGSVVDKNDIVVGEIKAYKDNWYIPYCTDKHGFAVFNTGTGQVFSPGKNGESGFTDDLTNDPLVKVPYSNYLISSCRDNQLVSIINMSEIEDKRFNQGLFKKTIEKLDIDSNPIIRIVTLK